MLSFLKMLQNWQKTRFWIGRSAVAPSDAAEKTRNMGAHCTTTVPRVYNCHKVILENLLPVWLLMCTNMFVPSHFWLTKFDPCYWRYIATCGNFTKIFLLSIRSGAHKLFRRFFDFSQFLIAILRKLWRHLATKPIII